MRTKVNYDFNQFNDNVKSIIDCFEKDIYIIIANQQIRCKCVNFDTKEADPDCKKCLGLGYKIKIYEKQAASMDVLSENISIRSDNKSVARKFFLKDFEITPKPYDLIIDNNEVFIVHESKTIKSFKGEPVYQYILGQNKKLNKNTFLKNFIGIVGM